MNYNKNIEREREKSMIKINREKLSNYFNEEINKFQSISDLNNHKDNQDQKFQDQIFKFRFSIFLSFDCDFFKLKKRFRTGDFRMVSSLV